jgi:putative transposase
VKLLRDGLGVCEVARMVGASPGSVTTWRQKYDRDGPAALASKLHAGPAPKLDDGQVTVLLALLARGATAHGYANDLWTLDRVAALIRKTFGVSYDPSGVWHLLRRAKWSSQKPESVAREQDPAAVARFRKVAWPRLKKGRPRRASRSS